MDEALRAEIHSLFEGLFGDRRMNRESIEAALDACLLSEAEAERGLAAWAKLPDPFGAWDLLAAAE